MLVYPTCRPTWWPLLQSWQMPSSFCKGLYASFQNSGHQLRSTYDKGHGILNHFRASQFLDFPICQHLPIAVNPRPRRLRIRTVHPFQQKTPRGSKYQNTKGLWSQKRSRVGLLEPEISHIGYLDAQGQLHKGRAVTSLCSIGALFRTSFGYCFWASSWNHHMGFFCNETPLQVT